MPILSSPTAAKSGATTATGSVVTDELNGTLYFLVNQSATPPSAATIIATGENQVVTGLTENVTITGLSPETTYYIHYVQKDAALNESNVVSSTSFTTDASGAVVLDIFYRTLLAGASL